jgi:hypothetical protein
MSIWSAQACLRFGCVSNPTPSCHSKEAAIHISSNGELEILFSKRMLGLHEKKRSGGLT